MTVVKLTTLYERKPLFRFGLETGETFGSIRVRKVGVFPDQKDCPSTGTLEDYIVEQKIRHIFVISQIKINEKKCLSTL